MMWDYFAARMKCPHCSAESPDDESTEMRTKIRPVPDMRCLRVGDDTVYAGELGETDYLVVKMPRPGEETRLLERWRCPTCREVDSWAEVVIDPRGIIESIQVTKLDLAAFNRAHGISPQLEDVYPAYTGEDLRGKSGLRKDFAEHLRQHLSGRA